MAQTLTDASTDDQTQPPPQTPTVPKPQVVKPPTTPTAPTPGPTQTPPLPVAQTPQGGGPVLPVAPAQTTDPMAFTTPPPTLSTTNAPTFAPVNTQAGDAPPGPNTTPTTSPTTTAPPKYTGPAAQPNMPNSPFAPGSTTPPPTISTLSGDEKTLYWAGKGALNPDALGLPPNASQAEIQAATQAYLAKNKAAIDAVTQKVQGGDAANLSKQNAAVTQYDTDQNTAAKGALDTALNNQPGYAGSGLAYADPNAPDPTATIANPLSPSQSPQGGVGNTTTQTGPTSQGGVVLPQNGLSNTGPGINLGGDTTSTTPTSTNTLGPSVQNGLPASGPNTAPTLTPLTPDNALTNSIIAPSANVNRFDVAKNQISDEIKNELEPQFNSDARTISAQSFGVGRGVSGNNRTKEGDLALQHSRDINQLTSNYLNPALTGTIQDSLNNANFAAGQQQFEAGQQNTAFNQAVTGQTLADQEQGQSFYQALQKLLAGSSGDPAQIQLLLSELYGGQSAQDSAAAGKLAQSAVA